VSRLETFERHCFERPLDHRSMHCNSVILLSLHLTNLSKRCILASVARGSGCLVTIFLNTIRREGRESKSYGVTGRSWVGRASAMTREVERTDSLALSHCFGEGDRSDSRTPKARKNRFLSLFLTVLGFLRIPVKTATHSGGIRPPIGAKRRWCLNHGSGGRFGQRLRPTTRPSCSGFQ
jgi:hypothetical protein